MASLNKKELFNSSLIVFSLTLMVLAFQRTQAASNLYVLVAIGVLTLLFFLFNRVLLISLFIALSFFDFSIEGLTYFKALGYVLLVVLTVHFLMKQIHIDFDNRLILLFIAIFLAAGASQLINKAVMPFYLIKLLMIFCMMVSINVFITNLEELKFVLLVLAVAGVIAAGTTIYEVILDPELKRAAGPMGNPNNMAAIFCMLLPYAAVVIEKKRTWQNILIAMLFMMIILAAIIFTASRGALLSLFAVSGAALLLFNLRGKLITIFSLLLLLLVFFAFFDNFQGVKRYERMMNSGSIMESRAVKIRLEITAIGLQMFMENPLLGVGAGNFQTETKDMETEYNGYLYGGIAPHNMYSQILAELGMIGFILFAVFYFTIFEFLFTGVRHPYPEIRRLAIILLFSFIAIMVSMATSGNYVKPFIYIIAGFALVIRRLALANRYSAKLPRSAVTRPGSNLSPGRLETSSHL